MGESGGLCEGKGTRTGFEEGGLREAAGGHSGVGITVE